MILDSSFIIDLIAVDEAAETKLQELVEDAVPITVSALTVTEVRRGIDTGDARDVFDNVMDAVTIAPFGYAEAMTAADLLRRLD